MKGPRRMSHGWCKTELFQWKHCSGSKPPCILTKKNSYDSYDHHVQLISQLVCSQAYHVNCQVVKSSKYPHRWSRGAVSSDSASKDQGTELLEWLWRRPRITARQLLLFDLPIGKSGIRRHRVLEVHVLFFLYLKSFSAACCPWLLKRWGWCNGVGEDVMQLGMLQFDFWTCTLRLRHSHIWPHWPLGLSCLVLFTKVYGPVIYLYEIILLTSCIL